MGMPPRRGLLGPRRAGPWPDCQSPRSPRGAGPLPGRAHGTRSPPRARRHGRQAEAGSPSPAQHGQPGRVRLSRPRPLPQPAGARAGPPLPQEKRAGFVGLGPPERSAPPTSLQRAPRASAHHAAVRGLRPLRSQERQRPCRESRRHLLDGRQLQAARRSDGSDHSSWGRAALKEWAREGASPHLWSQLPRGSQRAPDPNGGCRPGAAARWWGRAQAQENGSTPRHLPGARGRSAPERRLPLSRPGVPKAAEDLR